MKNKKAKISKDKINIHIAAYVVLSILTIFFLFPFFIVITRSFMTNKEVSTLPVAIINSGIYLGAFSRALDARLISYAGNTIIVTVFNVLAIPFTASLCAFGFTKLQFKGREFLFAFVLATIMMPAITTQIPLYVMYSKIGWIDTLFPLTVPAVFGGGAMNIFLIRQFMKGLPKDLDNAAKIDGAGIWKIYWKITLPLCKPILLFVMVSTFLGVWNDFMGPLLYLRSEENFTLSIGVYMKYLGTLTQINLPNEQMATGILMLIPPLIIFIIFQKQLINGVVFSGIKG